MFQPLLGGLNKIVKEAAPRYLDDTLETGILLLIDHLHKKTSMAAPEKKSDYYTLRLRWRAYQHSPGKESWMSYGGASMMIVDDTLP